MRGWLIAFLFTQVVEIPIWAFGLRRAEPRLDRRLAIAFGASLLTHPLVWFAFPRLVTGTYVGMVVVAELFAWFVEAMYMSGFGLKRALWWSLAANGASMSLGLLSRWAFGVP